MTALAIWGWSSLAVLAALVVRGEVRERRRRKIEKLAEADLMLAMDQLERRIGI